MGTAHEDPAARTNSSSSRTLIDLPDGFGGFPRAAGRPVRRSGARSKTCASTNAVSRTRNRGGGRRIACGAPATPPPCGFALFPASAPRRFDLRRERRWLVVRRGDLVCLVEEIRP